MISYNKSCYKVEYNMDTIIFNISIATGHSKMKVVYLHYIIQNRLNYISIKHFGN